MSAIQLLYFADAMCSWCWGFAPVIDALKARYGSGLPVRLIVGGLRPGTTEPMSDAAREELRGHWTHVTEASGQPFGPSGIDAPGFVYDTDPAARAVVLARRSSPAMGLTFLHAAQRAFYAGGQDITRPEVLADLGRNLGFDRQTFLEGLFQDELKAETVRDYALSQNAGVRGFPTLIVGPNPDNTFALVTRGFQPAEAVTAAVDGWLAARAAA